jgi:predicted AlkP superfamily phosphohydrolase/phosphomutase
LIDEFLRRGQAAESDGELEWDGTRDEQPRVGPLCQVYESIADQAKGLASLCEYLCSSREWDLLMTQIHAPDGLNHQLMNALYPESPQYDPSKVDEAWSAYREEIRALDRFVGEVVEECADEDTLVAVVSDHGAIPTHTKVWLGKWLVEAGLLAYKEDEGAGDIVVDWENTKVILGDHPLAQNVWVNLRGRESHGVVEPGREYEEVRNEVIRVLSGIVDPATGQSVVAQVMRWEDAQHLGQWGDCVGDLIYFLEPGYTNDVAIHSAGPIDPARMPQKALEPNDTSQQGVHHCYHPTARLGGFSVRGVLILAGPGVREKYARRTPLWMVDVAPTLAHFSGLPCPRDAEGAVALDLAAGSTVEGETPSAAPAPRPWEKPPEPEPEAESTDEPEEAEGEGPAEDPESAEQDDDEAETAPAEEG